MRQRTFLKLCILRQLSNPNDITPCILLHWGTITRRRRLAILFNPKSKKNVSGRCRSFFFCLIDAVPCCGSPKSTYNFEMTFYLQCRPVFVMDFTETVCALLELDRGVYRGRESLCMLCLDAGTGCHLQKQIP